MENTKDLHKIQGIIDNEFDKILKINLNNRYYHIAITKDQIPTIKEFSVSNNSIFISFDEHYGNFSNDLDYNIIKNKEGEITAISINHLNKFRSESYLLKFRRMLLNEIKNFPESNPNEVIQKHKQKRVAHAISEILKTVPNIG